MLCVLAHKALDDIGKALSELARGLATSSGVLWVPVRFALSGEVVSACREMCGNEPHDISQDPGTAGFPGFDLQEEISPDTVYG